MPRLPDISGRQAVAAFQKAGFEDQHLPSGSGPTAVERLPGHLGALRAAGPNRGETSLVDCVSREFMRLQGLRDVLALDPHFAEAGDRLLPAARK